MTTLQLIPYLTTEAAEVAAFGAKALRTIETVGLIGGEVFTAGAILWTLNAAGTAIEKTYNAGQAVGRVYFNQVKPVLDLIDWAEVRATLWEFALAAGVACYLAGETTARAFHAWHTEWIGEIDWTVPSYEPPTCTFDGLTVAQLRVLAREIGTKGAHKMRKAQLLEVLGA